MTRLLALVRLTAPQAFGLGADLLAAAARRGDAEPGSSDGDPPAPDRAIVTTGGDVVLAPAPGGGRLPAAGSVEAALGARLADVAGAARLRGRPADPAAERLLAELDRAAADLPDAGVAAVAERLGEAAAGIDRSAVRAELGALVRAVAGRGESSRSSGPAGSPSAAVRTPPARRGPTGESRTTFRRIGAWLLSIVVLAGVVVLEVAVLRDDIAKDVDLLLDAGRSGSAASTAPEPDGVPIVPPAPATAGDVTAVDLRPLENCAPATSCTVRLEVRLTPAPDQRPVTWSYRIVDRCTGAATTVPGGTLTVPAGGRRVAAVGTVALPDLQAAAVLAVTEQPAAAASPPVFAGSCLPDQPTE